jgi:Ca2+-binding RTX toxin-like protein
VAGGDAGDWAASAAPDSFLAFDNPGVVAPVTSTDLTVLDAIGWDPTSATPPPPAPDLTVSNLALTFTPSGAASLSFHINNVGTAEADNFNNSVALYSDSALTHQTESSLGSVPSVSALAAGASVTQSLTLLLTAPGLAGTYYIGVVADSGKTVTESNESNNTAALPVILGTSNTSTLNGTTGNDTIIGFSGHDTFYGGKGNDTLVVDSSTHANQFVFKATTDGVDTIVNFASGDVLDFSASVFGRHMAVGGGSTGTLDPSHFVAGGPPEPSSARTPEFWYDTTHNTLYYDSDGAGPAVPVAMAVLVGVANLHATDIHLI